MVKKLFLGMFAATAMLFATSCQNDELDAIQSGKESIVSFTLEQPGIVTRAYSDGLTAKTLTYAVYEANSKTPLITSENQVTFSNKTATVNLRLVTGKSYDILFWADAENTPYTFDAAAQTITVADNLTSQDENRDAFFAVEKSLLVDGAINKTITLSRPFAQLNIGTTDATESSTAAFNPTQSTVTVKNVYKTLNLFDGAVSNETEMTYAMANIPDAGETFPVADVKYLSMNYLLVASEKELVEVDFTVTDGTHSIEREYASVPVQRNYRTNIYGKILTDPADFNITIDEKFEKPDYIVASPWDGKEVSEPESTATEYLISSPAEWAWLKGKNLNGKNIKLTANIDFGGNEVKGLGFTGTFDGDGHIMSNMTLLCGGKYYSNGLFQGDASGEVTVKNVTIENAVAECSDEGQGYVGTIFGDVQNNVTLENVHVNGADLCGVQSVGGLVGFVASGKTLTLNNCSVSGSYIHNYAVDNESGFVAGLVGRPVGTVTTSNCEVNNTIVEGFYAARRGETSIAAAVGNQTPAGVTVASDVTVKKVSMDDVVLISSAEQLNQLTVSNKYVILTADIDFQGVAMTKPIEIGGNSTFDGQGHKISNVETAVHANYATSLFRGDANSGNKVVKNLIIEKLTTPSGKDFASAIWSDLQDGANIEIDNVQINDATIQANGTIGGFVGFVGGSTTYVIIKNSSISNSTLNGGEEDKKRGAVVGRAHGCSVTCKDVIVNNVKINDVAVTTSTLVGDKGYRGIVTIK